MCEFMAQCTYRNVEMDLISTTNMYQQIQLSNNKLINGILGKVEGGGGYT